LPDEVGERYKLFSDVLAAPDPKAPLRPSYSAVTGAALAFPFVS
jgi:hypothetical protein